MKKKKKVLVLISFLLFIVVFSYFQNDPSFNYQNQSENEIPQLAGDLEGAENILITELRRYGNLSGYGVVNIEDKMTILNNNDNPINSIYFGIPIKHSDDLIYFEAMGESKNSLLTERSNIVMHDFEMIVIYFDSPLLPYQTKKINILQTFQNLITYNAFYDPDLDVHHNYTYPIWPILPYRVEGDVYATFRSPSTAESLYFERIGSTGNIADTGIITYDLSKSFKYDYLDPFLENLEDNLEFVNGKEYITILFRDTVVRFSQIEVSEINRDILISPWGLIKIKEEFLITNLGYFAQRNLFLNIPADATNIYLFDDLGELSGTVSDLENSNRKKLEINLIQNRALLTPSSVIKFTLTYNLPFEKYITTNWLQESLQIDLLTTKYDYLGKKQTINILIEGCGNIDYISSPSIAIKQSGGSKIIVYHSDYVSPIENKIVLLTFSIDLFDLLLRPILIILAIAVISSLYVLLMKSRKREEDTSLFKKEYIPVSEIREFCSLYEEKNALILEIRKAETEAKRKKLAKKTYKNLLAKNTTKIDQIKNEIIPFKKVIEETNETFGNILKKLDVLDTERISVDDSLNLLETRYKRGRLPSKAAYQKLSDDFFNRRKKIDRTIDRYIQQLRSYLL